MDPRDADPMSPPKNESMERKSGKKTTTEALVDAPAARIDSLVDALADAPAARIDSLVEAAAAKARLTERRVARERHRETSFLVQWGGRSL